MFTNTSSAQEGDYESDTEFNETTSIKSGVRKYLMDVLIPPECMDPDGGDCPHTRHPDKKAQNPV